jgi:hypothetical protein
VEKATRGADYPNMWYCGIDGDGQIEQPNRGWTTDASGKLVLAEPTQQELSDGENVGGLTFPVLTMQKLWTGDIVGRQSKQAGDFAAAIVVAHEFGHHVADEWLTQYNAQQEQSGGTAVKPAEGKWNELLADCFAGVWANTAYYQGLLEPGDIEEGVAAQEAVGDDGTGPDPHGSPQERAQAVWDGYNSGDPSRCAGTYWKTTA